jgi:hypothetical protein
MAGFNGGAYVRPDLTRDRERAAAARRHAMSTRNPLGLRTNQRPCANTQSQRLCPSRKSSVRRALLARCEAELRGAARPIGNRRAFATLLSRCHSP